MEFGAWILTFRSMSAIEIILGFLGLVAFIWVTYSVWSDKGSRYTTLMKVLWTASAFFFSIITAIVYWFIEKRK